MGKASLAKTAIGGLSGLLSGGGGQGNANIDPALLQLLQGQADLAQKTMFAAKGMGGSTNEAYARSFAPLGALMQANQSANTTAQQQIAAGQQASNIANQLGGQQASDQGAQSVTGNTSSSNQPLY